MNLLSGHSICHPSRLGNIHAAIFLVVTYMSSLLLLSRSADAQQPIDISYQIEEEIEVGSFIGNILYQSRLDRSYSDEILRTLNFRFLKQDYVSKFHLDEKSGTLSTNDRIDRDSLCPRADECMLRLDVAIQPPQYFRIIRINMNITDKNDNAPRFPDSELVFDVLETAVPGTGLVIPSAADPDSRKLSIHTYKIIKERDVNFDLKEFRKPNDATELRLILTKPLDRETVASYNMKVEAIDGGVPPLTGTVQIHINVVDVNDHSPIFVVDSYETTISEYTPAHTTILVVRATDKDSDLNGKVVYDLSSVTSSQFGHLFAVNNYTGEVYLKQMVDFEELDVYRLVITATDMGPESMPATVTATVHILDYNDNAPVIVIDTFSKVPGVAETSEGAEIGTFVAHVKISDRDSGLNGRFNCEISDTTFSINQLYGTDYKVTTSAVLDREVKDNYHVAITCTDMGDDPQASVEHFVVSVTDINDNDPVFDRSTYTGEIIENNYIDLVVLHFNATDVDVGVNSELSFILQGENAESFLIDSATKTLKTLSSFDHEKVSSVRLTLIGKDGGTPPRSGSATIDINIIDINDEYPTFSEPSYTFTVMEEQGGGKSVGTVGALDRDSGPGGTVLYSLGKGEEGDHHFGIDSDTGRIFTKSNIDREINPEFHLTVYAIDQGLPQRTSSVSVKVLVGDINDKSPQFPTYLRINNTFYVSTLASRGYVITRLLATDDDLGENARVTYELYTQRLATDLFALNSHLGILTVAGYLGESDGAAFELKITARDEGSPSRSTYTYIYIFVNSSAPITGEPEHSWHRAKSVQHNLAIVVSVTVVSGIIAVCLVTAIVLLRRPDRRRAAEKRSAKYNCRMKAINAANYEATNGNVSKYQGNMELEDDFYTECRNLKADRYGELVPNGKSNSNKNNQNSVGSTFRSQPKQGGPIVYGVLATTDASTRGGDQDSGRYHCATGGGNISALSNIYQPDPSNCQTPPERARSGVPGDTVPSKRLLDAETLRPHMKTTDVDVGSVHSAEGSNTDSGQGTSETEALTFDNSGSAIQTKHLNTGLPTLSYSLTTVPEDSYSSTLGCRSKPLNSTFCNPRYSTMAPSNRNRTKNSPSDRQKYGQYPPEANHLNHVSPTGSHGSPSGDFWTCGRKSNTLQSRCVKFAPDIEPGDRLLDQTNQVALPRFGPIKSSGFEQQRIPPHNDGNRLVDQQYSYRIQQYSNPPGNTVCDVRDDGMTFNGVRLSTV